MTDLTIYQAEVQDRADALTGASPESVVREVGIAANVVEKRGGVIDRTILDVELQRIADDVTGSSTNAELIATGAALENLGGSASAGAVVKKFQLFTSSGTWPVPSAINGKIVRVTLIGGGASGNVQGGFCCGGPSGQLIYRQLVDIGSATSVSVTVGVGGAGIGVGGGANPGNAGAPSSFGAFLVASGGVAPGSSYIDKVFIGAAPGYTTLATSPNTSNTFLPEALKCPEAGSVFTKQSTTTYASGAGGINLGNNPPSGGDSGFSQGLGGKGFGAGGGGKATSGSGSSGGGAQGCVLVEWEEAI